MTPSCPTLRSSDLAWVIDQFLAAERVAEQAPELLVGGAHDEIAILGAHRLIRRAHAVGGAERLGDLAGAPVFGRVPDREGERRIEQRSVDILTTAGGLAADIGGEDGIGNRKSVG